MYAGRRALSSELGAERRTVLPLTEIPLPVRQAFIATEDKRFYDHHGSTTGASSAASRTIR